MSQTRTVSLILEFTFSLAQDEWILYIGLTIHEDLLPYIMHGCFCFLFFLLFVLFFFSMLHDMSVNVYGAIS